MWRKVISVLMGFMVLLTLMVGIGSPAQASTFGTYSNCMNYASYYARVGVYWETSGTSVRPYQVWFDRAAAGIYSMNVKHYTSSVMRESHTFPQGGQTSQVHNWTGLAWGAKNTSQWVDFRLTLSNGSSCTGRVYPVAT